jgi:hypothetical protein
MTPLRRPCLALAFAAWAALAHADPAADDRKQALREFSDAYGIAQLWPRLTPKVARDSMPRLREAALADLAADGLDPEWLAVSRTRLDGLVPAARAELEAALRALDADELAAYAAFEIYAKYFETAELREMAAFFGSATGRKMAALSPEILAETRDPGGTDVMARHFSADELREIAAFWQSPVGEKMRRTSLDVRDALHRHFMEVSEPALQRLARRLAAEAEGREAPAGR